MFIWEGVSEFVAVAELESFTAASKKLDISTAQVSRQITALEKRLSCKLFYRTTRRVSVTDIGRVYYQHCRQVLDGLDEAERAISDLQTTPKGSLKMTAPGTYGEETVAPLVNEFLSLYPELDIQLNLSNQKQDLVAEGYDVAIRLGQLEDSSMMAQRLSSRTQYVCASPLYIKKYGVPHSLSELDKHNCLIGTLNFWRFRENNKEKHIKVKGNLSCNSGRALCDAAVKGIGIVQLPDYYVSEYIDSGELVTLLEGYREEDDHIWALYPHNRHLSSKVQMLVDFLKEKLQQP
ncbi:LysR family transcriptional regulator [Vibrio sp. MACH09]|uniref:LysR substrate-binding domain-containing protein n=1 Tax=unclassified Vibrio TaxID=2614977 RepID=UPI001493B80E|nr:MULTISPECIES: LysR substrate-binding domain-containing protein [unclassified Vibrio]NOI64673.1 LysR family transcriptional regulator [Vibrio sp. 99-8-1]GLO63115.1 LysR family transcriptional regulator [Vibrio sp. MACH09]